MESFLTFVHVLLCIFLIVVVLLQTSKGAEIGAAFGGASRTLFGSSGATSVMGKVTTAVAILFMITCLSLAYYSGKPNVKSIMDKPSQEATSQTQSGATPSLPEAKPLNPLEATKKEAEEKQSPNVMPSNTAETPAKNAERADQKK